MSCDNRVIFFKGKQKEFIDNIKEKSNLNWKELALLTKFNYHRLRHELRNEIYSMSYGDFVKFCKIIDIEPNSLKSSIREFRDKGWGQKLGGNVTGNKNRGKIKIKIKIPPLNSKLSEFIGILLGDGSISRTHYSIDIVLNKITDRFYLNYVLSLYKELFGLTPPIRERGNTYIIRVNSLALFKFLKDLGLPHGQTKKYIPWCILSKKDLKYACLRGLFDTDGSLSLSSRWCVLNFCSSSSGIYSDFFNSLNEIGVKPIRSGNMINLTSLWKIQKFFKTIGSSNLKNIIKYLEYTENHISLKSVDTPRYYKTYKSIKLPFISGL